MGRTRVAFGGAILAAIIGAVVAMLMMAQTNPAGPAIANATATSPSSGTATPTKTPVATASPTIATIPTEIPTRAPTPTPQVGQPTTIHGTIASLSSNGFQLHRFSGSNVTVVVDAQTTYQGAATSFGGLQQGMQADVAGAYQADGTFLATRVDTDN